MKLVDAHLSYFVLTCAFIMFVVKYAFVLVNSPLIVESLVFLVHMQIF